MADTKLSTDSVIPAEVTELIGESQKIQGWIEKLAELRDETTPAVLAEVTSRLSTHQSDLSKTLDKRRTDVEKLRTERDEQAAELEEAKLRFAVGEYGSDEWDERRGRIERGLQSIKDRLSAEDATLDELQAILASIPPEGSATKGAQEPAAAPAWMASAAATEAVSEVAAEGTAEAPKKEPAKTAEEADAEKPEKMAATAAKSGAKDKEGGEAEGDEGEYLDELEFLESLSLEESDRFDAVSAMLDEEEGGKGGSE
jgi:chromosome segregation protein